MHACVHACMHGTVECPGIVVHESHFLEISEELLAELHIEVMDDG